MHEARRPMPWLNAPYRNRAVMPLILKMSVETSQSSSNTLNERLAKISPRVKINLPQSNRRQRKMMSPQNDDRQTPNRSRLPPETGFPRLCPREERAARAHLDAAHLAGAATAGRSAGGADCDVACRSRRSQATAGDSGSHGGVASSRRLSASG